MSSNPRRCQFQRASNREQSEDGNEGRRSCLNTDSCSVGACTQGRPLQALGALPEWPTHLAQLSRRRQFSSSAPNLPRGKKSDPSGCRTTLLQRMLSVLGLEERE